MNSPKTASALDPPPEKVRTFIHPATLAAPARLNPLTAWHLFSLDAPTVATLWTVFIARTLHHPLPPTLAPAMFLTVWVLYAADRLLDARLPEARPQNRLTTLQPRHVFHRRHARLFKVSIGLSLAALLPLIAALPRPLLLRYTLAGALLALWLTLVHLLEPTRQRRLHLLKEAVVGIFFSAAIFLPSPAPSPASSLCPILFACLGTLDGLFITAWETDPANPNTRPLAAALLLALAAAVTPAFLPAFPAIARPIPQAIALAAVLFLPFNHYRHRLHPTTLRAAADALLLTPILFLWHP